MQVRRASIFVAAVMAAATLPTAAPASAEGPGGWVVVDGDAVMWVDDPGASPAGGGTAQPADVPGPGHVRYGEWGIEDLTIRLVESSSVEHFRPDLVHGADEVSNIAGVDVRVASGRVNRSNHADLDPRPGEILVVVSGSSPCETTKPNWAGCGGPKHVPRSSISQIEHQQAGVIWFRPTTLGTTSDDLRHLVLHELGHAVGLRHFDGTYNGATQVMHSGSFVAHEYQAGDRNGIRAQGVDGRRDFYSWSTSPNASTFRSVVGTYKPFSGDFDGDGRDDVFWYAAGSAQDYIWWGASRSVFPISVPEVNVQGSYTPISGDFDGDGADDIFWWGPGGVSDSLWWGRARSSWPQVGSVSPVNGTNYRPVSGDFDADGDDELFFYGPGGAPDTMYWGAPRSSWPEKQSFTVNGTYRPFVDDLDGEAGDDIFWYAPGSATDYAWWGTTTNVLGQRGAYPNGSTSTPFQVSGTYQTAVGDFDADGHAEVLWHGAGVADDYRWDVASRTSHVSQSIEIGNHHTLVVGDFDGDGADDILGYRPGT